MQQISKSDDAMQTALRLLLETTDARFQATARAPSDRRAFMPRVSFIEAIKVQSKLDNHDDLCRKQIIPVMKTFRLYRIL